MKVTTFFALCLIVPSASFGGSKDGRVGKRFLEDTTETKACRTSPVGDFGTLSGSITMLEFSYEVEYDRFEYRIGDILDKLEASMVESILPLIFGENCSGENRKGNMEQYVGVSAKPSDIPLKTGFNQCKTLQREQNRCQVLKGRITLYQKKTPKVSTLDILTRALEKTMQSEGFDGIGGAERVSYVQILKTPVEDIPVCNTVDGEYGDVSPTSNNLSIDFGYEMEVLRSLNNVEPILPKLKLLLINQLLPKLFPSSCAERDDQQRRNLVQSTIGISKAYGDSVIDNLLSCQPKFDSSNLCIPVHGRITVYQSNNNGSEDAVQLKEQVLLYIQQVMAAESTALRSSHPSIVDLRYFPFDPDDHNNSNNRYFDSNSKDFPLWIILIIGVVLVFLCTAMVAAWFCCCSRSTEEKSLSDTSDDMGDSPGARSVSDVEDSFEKCPGSPIANNKEATVRRGSMHSVPGSPRTKSPTSLHRGSTHVAPHPATPKTVPAGKPYNPSPISTSNSPTKSSKKSSSPRQNPQYSPQRRSSLDHIPRHSHGSSTRYPVTRRASMGTTSDSCDRKFKPSPLSRRASLDAAREYGRSGNAPVSRRASTGVKTENSYHTKLKVSRRASLGAESGYEQDSTSPTNFASPSGGPAASRCTYSPGNRRASTGANLGQDQYTRSPTRRSKGTHSDHIRQGENQFNRRASTGANKGHCQYGMSAASGRISKGTVSPGRAHDAPLNSMQSSCRNSLNHVSKLGATPNKSSHSRRPNQTPNSQQQSSRASSSLPSEELGQSTLPEVPSLDSLD